MDEKKTTPEAVAEQVRRGIVWLRQQGRDDLLLSAIGLPLIEELRIEAAKGTLSPLLITRDYRFLLTAYNKEVELTPVHKAVYLLFLNHPEGIEFKCLSDYRRELSEIYKKISNRFDVEKIEESVDRLTNPLDNAIHEKCSRIKSAFTAVMDDYSASYYIISSHRKRTVPGTEKVWYQRRKVISLPRHLVIREEG